MMTDKKKNPSGGDREGAEKYRLPKLTKPKPFPQAPLLWQAHRECYQRVQNDPTPVNLIVARIVAREWKAVHRLEALS